MENFAKFILAVFITTSVIMFNGWIFYNAYNWFIVTAYHAPYLTLAQCMGVTFFINVIQYKSVRKDEPSFTELLAESLKAAARDLVLLLIGYLLYCFIY